GPALRHQIVPLTLTGLAAGLLVGCFLSRLRLRRLFLPGLVMGGALLLSLAFVTPFLTLQKLVPLFAVLRFPRFYILAVLGLALGSAYPFTVLERWSRRRSDVWPYLPAVAAVAALALFVVDILPLRSGYFVAEPALAATYRHASESLPASSRQFRVATG